MDIENKIKAAHSAATEAGLPADFEVAAFREVLRHLLAEEATPGTTKAAASTPLAAASGPGFAKLAARMKTDENSLADVFDIEGDSLSVHVPSGRIATTKSRATREIALLVVGGRQGAGLDESWTAVSHVRDALNHYNRYDQSNFSAHLRGIEDLFNFRGKGVSTELRLTQPGWEAASAFIRSVAGVSE